MTNDSPDDLNHNAPTLPGPTSFSEVLSDVEMEAILAQQRLDWLAGKGTPASGLLAHHPLLTADPALAAELVFHEFVLRQHLGQTPSWDAYLQEFPQYADQLQWLRQADHLLEAALSPESIQDLPTSFRGYQILEKIGQGGMGVVFKAQDRKLKRIVALKTIHTPFPSPSERRSFLKEAQTVAHLSHPNIVQIYEVGECDGQPFLALEYLPGRNLKECLDGTPLPAKKAASLVRVLAQAVDHAHHQGVIHRDLKPANVLLAENALDSVPKITDFGLAKRLDPDITGKTTIIQGTPSYMAPEQAEPTGPLVDPRIDIYGLGAILYELLTARPPFKDATPLQTLQQVLHSDPVRPSALQTAVPRDLETICLKCLEKKPASRYPSAAALAEDLERFLQGKPVKARRVSAVGHVWRWARRKPALATLSGAVSALALAFVLSLLVGYVMVLHQLHETELAHQEAQESDEHVHHLLDNLLQPNQGFAHAPNLYRTMPKVEVLEQAEKRFAQQLRKNPEDTRARIILTNLRGGLAILYLPQSDGRCSRALAAAQRLWEERLQQHPGESQSRDWLATTYKWQAHIAHVSCKPAQVLLWTERALALRQELADEQPNNLDWQENVAADSIAILDGWNCGPFAAEAEAGLEALRTRLVLTIQDNSGSRSTRKRLAFTLFLLGELQLGVRSPAKGAPYWRKAYDHYKKLLHERPSDLQSKLQLARCCFRLGGQTQKSPYRAEAVKLFQEVIAGFNKCIREHPSRAGLRLAELESACLLAVCHWIGGESEQGERVYRQQIRPLADHLGAMGKEPNLGIQALKSIFRAAIELDEAEHPARMLLARELGHRVQLCIDAPTRDPSLSGETAEWAVSVSAFLCRRGCAEEALHIGEQARRLYVALQHSIRDVVDYRPGVSNGWERIGKARWALGQKAEALAAFAESAEVLRPVVERFPETHQLHTTLSRAYKRLAYYSRLAGERSIAAQAMRNWKKLWPQDKRQLLEIAGNFRELAEEVGKSCTTLTAEEQRERERYLWEGQQTKREADAMP